ncbi:clock circadian regulator b, partial [Silurus meridionalis]
ILSSLALYHTVFNVCHRDDGSIFDELMEGDERDKAKRVSRNKSEKRRRDQFNVLIKELGTLLPANTRRMDKSTILQKSIDYLRKQKEITAQSESSEIRQDWKPPFLSNEEFTQLMLEALDGFFLVILTDGNVIYVSESVTSLLGHLPVDLVDQNLLNFLPTGEHSDVYKALSSHPEAENLSPEYLKTKGQLEFCCHMLRGSVEPKDPAMFEYVRFIGNFKSLSNMPRISRNGLEGVLQQSLRPAFDDHVCFVATVRLTKPQFIKARGSEMCTIEEPNEEFTSRHSLEWKFLLLDHRAPPIIGYLPFEVLGTSGYDYYHVDDLESLAKCHEHLMQFGKGKSCYYRFLTKGQQWIWLQTHYYITYHQWNSRPEFIVCTHNVVSYAEVRAEKRREMGIEDSPPERTVDKSQDSGSESQLNTSSLKEVLERFDHSPTPSTSSHSSRKSSHTAMSDSMCTCNNHTCICQDRSSCSRLLIISFNIHARAITFRIHYMDKSIGAPDCSSHIFMIVYTLCVCVCQYSAQLNAMQHLKEQLEQRTQMIEANIKKQQEELRQIHEQLQKVQGQNLQGFLWKNELTSFFFYFFSSFKMYLQQSSAMHHSQVGGASGSQAEVGVQVVTSTAPNRTHRTLQPQQAPPPQNSQGSVLTQGSVSNTMMVSQPGGDSVLQVPSTPSHNITQVTTINRISFAFTIVINCFSYSLRFPGQQLVTKLVTAPMACSTVMVPTTMFMGQVVTAYNPFAQQQPQQQQQGRTQAIAAVTDSQQQGQPQGAILPQQQQPFLQGTHILQSNQSTQLILQAFPIQQQGAFTTTAPQPPPHQPQQKPQQQLKPQTPKQAKTSSSHHTDTSSTQSQ